MKNLLSTNYASSTVLRALYTLQYKEKDPNQLRIQGTYVDLGMRWVIRNLGLVWRYLMTFYTRKLRILLFGFFTEAEDD